MNNKITIGITSYNAADTIDLAIESALQQNFQDFEIVVVDDYSTDMTWDIVQKYTALYPEKIRAFKNDKNIGVAGTRNRIIAEAQGQFLAFFDDDDISVPDRLQKQWERITNYEHNFAAGAPVICHANRTQKYPHGIEIITTTMGCHLEKIAPSGQNMAARILYNKKIDGGDGSMPTCSQMARISIYKDLGGFDENFRRMEDTEFNVRLALAGVHFVGVAEPLVVQKMTQADDKKIHDERTFARMMYQKHRLFLENQGRGDFDFEWLEAKHDYWEGFRFQFLCRLVKLFIKHPILSFKRFIHSLPNFSYNNALRHFHADKGLKL